MATYALRALVLKKTKLGEIDVIVSLLSDEGKHVRAVAKGMRKPGSRIGGRLEPYGVVDLLVRSGRSLDTIVEVEAVRTRATIYAEYSRSVTASVVVDVIDKLSVEGQVEPRIFGLADATLEVLEDAPAKKLQIILVGFLVKAMAMHGCRPVFDRCACCSKPTGHGVSRRFSLSEGGTICPGCRDTAGHSMAVSSESCALLGDLLYKTMAEIAADESEHDQRVVEEAFALMHVFAKHHLPVRLRALDLYREIL